MNDPLEESVAGQADDAGSLAARLEAMRRMHAIATGFIRQGDLAAVLREVMETALFITGADMGTLEVLEEPAGELKVAVHRGFGAEPVVVEGVAGTPSEEAPSEALRAVGIRASRGTPIRHHSGKLMGLLATHHRAPHRARDGELELLDLLAEQCADALERARWAAACALQTERAQRESDQRFRNTVENIPLNLVLYDRDFRLVYLNPTLAALCAAYCKVAPSEIVGKAGAEVWPEAIWLPLRAHTLRAIETGERQTYELDLTLPGRPRAVRQWTVVPLTGPEGDVREILAMSHDITAQRRLVDELREIDRRKSEFIAVLSHELRNPLAAIRSSLYVLEHGEGEGDTAARARNAIDRQVGQLVRIVDDLLDISRITQSKIQLQRRRLDLNDHVRQTVADNHAHLARGGVRLETRLADGPVPIDADGARLAQVITNLLSNAAKFTPAGGLATVSVSVDAARAQAVVRVSDTGVGIEADVLALLFQPFTQAARTLDLAAGGLGLGLALVKGLVQLHDGEVGVASDGRNKGAEFTVRLPLARAPAPGVAPAEVPGAKSERRRVLIIEDNTDVAKGLQEALAIVGHTIEVARNGHEGIAKALVFRPDVVLCDIGLPDIDGNEVARRFRADARLSKTLLIALSGFAQPDDVERARAAGFDQHVAKPASMQRIAELLATSARVGD